MVRKSRSGKKKRRKQGCGFFDALEAEIEKEQTKTGSRRKGKGKAWRRGESKRLRRSERNYYVSINSEGVQSDRKYIGKSVTEDRDETEVALGVAKKVWSRDKSVDHVEVMHLSSKQRFTFDPRTWTPESGKRKFSSSARRKHRRDRFIEEDIWSEAGGGEYPGSPKRGLTISAPKETSPRAFKSPRTSLSSSPGSTGLTPRMSSASLTRRPSSGSDYSDVRIRQPCFKDVSE